MGITKTQDRDGPSETANARSFFGKQVCGRDIAPTFLSLVPNRRQQDEVGM